MNNFAVQYKDLCDVFFSVNKSFEDYLRENYPVFEDDQINKIVGEINKRFLPQLNLRLRSVHRIRTKLNKKYCDWLQGVFVVNFISGDLEAVDLSANREGRLRKNFEDCCDRAKKYKVREHRDSFSQDLINAAATSSAPDANTRTFDADSALALITQMKLTKYQYSILRKATADIGHDIFPTYQKILEAKKKCYPSNIMITEKSAQVSLQDLLDHTTRRIFETKSEAEIEKLEEQNLILHTKWGCDGASSQSEYMQKFSDPQLDIGASNLFMTSIVPLKLTLLENETNYVWNNFRPSSTRYCRALKFEFIKETPSVTQEEKIRVDSEIEGLETKNGSTCAWAHF